MAKSAPPTPEPFPLRWAVILLAATMIAFLVGALTLLQTASWPATLLAALARPA